MKERYFGHELYRSGYRKQGRIWKLARAPESRSNREIWKHFSKAVQYWNSGTGIEFLF